MLRSFAFAIMRRNHWLIISICRLDPWRWLQVCECLNLTVLIHSSRMMPCLAQFPSRHRIGDAIVAELVCNFFWFGPSLGATTCFQMEAPPFCFKRSLRNLFRGPPFTSLSRTLLRLAHASSASEGYKHPILFTC